MCPDPLIFSSPASDHRLADTYHYFERHPQIKSVDNVSTGLQLIHDEYSTLSRAVHGSAKSFRMTVDSKSTLLWSDSKSSLGAWSTREGATVLGLNFLLMTMFREELQGTSQPNLRNVLSLVIPSNKHQQIQKNLKIVLPKA